MVWDTDYLDIFFCFPQLQEEDENTLIRLRLHSSQFFAAHHWLIVLPSMLYSLTAVSRKSSRVKASPWLGSLSTQKTKLHHFLRKQNVRFTSCLYFLINLTRFIRTMNTKHKRFVDTHVWTRERMRDRLLCNVIVAVCEFVTWIPSFNDACR